MRACLFLVAAAALVAAGCSSKPDIGDADVKLQPGQAKAPGAPLPPGGGGGAAGSAGGPTLQGTATPGH